jgi:hypothetical protein
MTSNGVWTILSSTPQQLELLIHPGSEGAVVDKTISIRDGHHAIYQEHRISGYEGRSNYGTHPILDFSSLPPDAGRVSVSPFSWASVYPGGFSNPEKGEHGALLSGAEFSDLRKVPLAAGGTTDLTYYPARSGFDDLVMMVNEPSTSQQPFAWSAAVLSGWLWFSLKNPRDFPATLLWISNGGRFGAPWNGRHTARMGIEEVCSHFCDGPEISNENRLASRGVPTSRAFVKNDPVTLRIVQGAALCPENFGQVSSIVPEGKGAIRITSDSGRSVVTEVDWSYIS